MRSISCVAERVESEGILLCGSESLDSTAVAMSVDRHVGGLLSGRSTFNCFMST